MKQETNLRDWRVEYLIDPLRHSNSSCNICVTSSSSSSILILVLSHYKNYDLR